MTWEVNQHRGKIFEPKNRDETLDISGDSEEVESDVSYLWTEAKSLALLYISL